MAETTRNTKDPDVLIPEGIDFDSLTEQQVKSIEGSIIGQVEQRWLRPWLRSRRPIDRQTLLNHAFLNGHQYVQWYGDALTSIPRQYQGQVRLVNNLFKPTARTLLSMITMNKPIKDAQAMTTDFVAEVTAELANKLLRHGDRATGNVEKDLEMFRWLLVGGNAAKRCAWNVGKGPWEELPAVDKEGHQLFIDEEDDKERPGFEVDTITDRLRSEDPMFDPGERFTPIVDMVRAGELDTLVLSPFQYCGHPAVVDLDDHEIVFIQNTRTLEYIRAQWPEKGKDVVPDNKGLILWEGGQANILPGMGMPQIQGFTSNYKETMPPQAVVTEMFIRPTEKNPLTGDAAPNGVHFVWAGQIALTALDNPLPYSEPPIEDAKPDLDFDFVHYRWFKEPGFWGSPFFTDLLPLQMSYNRRRSQINESINAFVHPKLQVSIGSRIRRKSFGDLPGEQVVYSGTPASYLEPPTIRPYVFNSMETDVQQFNDVAMLHEATRQGRPPPQVRTAAGLRFLQESDNRALGQTIAMYEIGEAKYGQKMLDRMNQFYEDGRMIKYVGARNTVEVDTFRSQIFQYDWTVYVHPGSAMPDSRAAKIAEANEMLQFAPQMFVKADQAFDKELYARLIGRADIDSFMADADTSRQTAETEELNMDNGVFQPVLSLDDHAAHIRVHEPKVRSNEFRKLMEDAPELAQLKLEHLQQHEQKLQEQIQMEQQRAQMISANAQSAQAASNAVMAQNAGAAAASEARQAVEDQEAQAQEGGQGGSTQALLQQLTANMPQPQGGEQ